MALYLGIDGGGTKTRCALGDETDVLATSAAGPSNVIRVGAALAREALHAAVRVVCEAAQVSPAQIIGVCIGAAGAAREDVAEQIRNIFRELTLASVDVVPDSVIALEAAFGDGAGIIAISGTGSIVYGRNARGETARAGGWGYAISDEGSAQWIGRRAVWSILRAFDQGEETKLASLVLNTWKLQTLDDLVHTANAVPPPEFPTLFPLVLRAAHDGDTMAAAVLTEAGTQLADQATIVIRRLFLNGIVQGQDRANQSRVGTQPATSPSAQKPTLDEHARVATTGSVFRQSGQVREVFYNHLQASFPGIEIRKDFVEPVDGALGRARKHH